MAVDWDALYGRLLYEEAVREGAQDVLDFGDGTPLDQVCDAVFRWDTYLIVDLGNLLRSRGFEGCAAVIDEWYDAVHGDGDGDPEDFDCVLCGRHVEGVWGNDPWPLAERGYCCGGCNDRVVEARLANIRRGDAQ